MTTSDQKAVPPMTPMLFEPITIRGVTARNRIMFAPMAMYSTPTGIPSDWHLVHLGSRAVGGAGIVMTEATSVCPEGRVSLFDAGMWSDEHETAWARIASFVSEQGSVPGMQLAHGGRKASHTRPWEGRSALSFDEGGWEVVAPSPIAWSESHLTPHALSHEEIATVVSQFRDSAERAYRAGFQILEVHAAHGYLINSFLSPLSNDRTDQYGGSLENRARFLTEIVTAIREVWPADLPLFVRLSATDWIDGGWTGDDTVQLAVLLGETGGVDAIDCSSGGTGPQQVLRPHPGYQVEFAARIKRETGLMSIAVGLIYEAELAESTLQAADADIVAIGRMALWDPYWPIHASVPLGVEPPLPVQYARSGIHLRSDVSRANNRTAVSEHH